MPSSHNGDTGLPRSPLDQVVTRRSLLRPTRDEEAIPERIDEAGSETAPGHRRGLLVEPDAGRTPPLVVGLQVIGREVDVAVSR